MTDRPVIRLDFAAALSGRQPVEGGAVFVTSEDSLPAFGPVWAIGLQAAIHDWDEHSELWVLADRAVAYGLEAVTNGLQNLVVSEDSPAKTTLALYCRAQQAKLHTRAPRSEATWYPVVPVRKSAKRRKTGSNL